MHDAFRELINDEIIIIRKYEDVDHYCLDIHNKKSEIRNFIRQEPFIERAKLVKPESKYFEGYDEQFIRSTERAWPNRGSYYYCTKKEDSKHWKVIIVTKPNTKTVTINFGSLADPKSRISKMWEVIFKIWENRKTDTIYKKMAEDKDQKLFGNNRQPSTAIFHIFEYLGWIKEVGKYRNSILYKVVKST